MPHKASCRYSDGDLVLVDWIDASSCTSWVPFEDGPLAVMICQSVGWIQSNTRASLALYAERAMLDGKVDNVGSRTVIPKVCVKKVTVLRKGGA